jgi:hypothetical protein
VLQALLVNSPLLVSLDLDRPEVGLDGGVPDDRVLPVDGDNAEAVVRGKSPGAPDSASRNVYQPSV